MQMSPAPCNPISSKIKSPRQSRRVNSPLVAAINVSLQFTVNCIVFTEYYLMPSAMKTVIFFYLCDISIVIIGKYNETGFLTHNLPEIYQL